MSDNQEPIEKRSDERVATRGVNVRRSPKMTGEVMFIAAKGTLFHVRGESGEWTRVVLPEERRHGFVMSKYLAEK